MHIQHHPFPLHLAETSCDKPVTSFKSSIIGWRMLFPYAVLTERLYSRVCFKPYKAQRQMGRYTDLIFICQLADAYFSVSISLSSSFYRSIIGDVSQPLLSASTLYSFSSTCMNCLLDTTRRRREFIKINSISIE